MTGVLSSSGSPTFVSEMLVSIYLVSSLWLPKMPCRELSIRIRMPCLPHQQVNYYLHNSKDVTITPSSSIVENPEQAALISSLRDMIQQQAVELENLRALSSRPPEPRENFQDVALMASLRDQLQRQSSELERLQKQIAEVGNAHEEEVRLCQFFNFCYVSDDIFFRKHR